MVANGSLINKKFEKVLWGYGNTWHRIEKWFVIEKKVNKESEDTLKEGKLEERFKKFVRKVIIAIKVFEENERENKRVDMADEFKMMLPVFDGNDYNTWKKRIMVFLRMNKMWKGHSTWESRSR